MSDTEGKTDGHAVQNDGKRCDGQVTLNQMLKVLDKDIATNIEKRLKKLSKKKALKPVVNEQGIEQANRKVAYQETVDEVSKWEPIISLNRQSNLRFPLDVQPDSLPTTAESLGGIKPRNSIEKEIQMIIEESEADAAKEHEKKRADEQYQKAISADEARERHLELQKARFKLSEFASRMRRQNKIKSKGYHRLLKHERIKKHMRRVESSKDALMDEIERLQKIRAQERASLKHKNTGKWAKHAKFRAKYDEEARKLMLEQIGIAGKLLEKPAMPESDSESEAEEDYDIDEDDSEDDEELLDGENRKVPPSGESEDEDRVKVIIRDEDDSASGSKRQPILSCDPPIKGTAQKRANDADTWEISAGDNLVAVDDNQDEEQRNLMSEAFANDDVVGEFQKAKDQIAGEEQPKDQDNYLPGWNDWAGPGIKINERKRQKFIKKAEKVKRKDETMSHVIISEKANSSIKDLQPKQLPMGIRNESQFRKLLSRPVTATFTDQSSFREAIQPKIVTKMGARIEPISKRVLNGRGKASFA